MSRTPFMPLWVGDFLVKTNDLGTKEVGAYMLILMTMWNRGGYLPNDQKKLQRVARVGRDWPKVWGEIEHFFEFDGERIWQPRLIEEVHKVAAKREVNAHNGARGGRAKALKINNADVANASESLKQSESYSENTPPNPPRGASDFSQKRVVGVPEGVLQILRRQDDL